MLEIAMWMAGIAGFGIAYVAWRSHAQETKFFDDRAAEELQLQLWEHGMAKHTRRCAFELTALTPTPHDNTPAHLAFSGETVTDRDDVVHALPANCVAMTACLREIRPTDPVRSVYTYDDPPRPVTCMTCMAREG